MLEQVGISKTVDQARRLGMGSVPSVPSLALGSGEVTLMAMTSAYSAFADFGQLRSPTLIRRVEDAEGKVLFETKVTAEQVLSPHTAFQLTSMLADVINHGTAYKARLEGFTLPAAGKTGTTNDYVDAWFVGYTPHLATGVWIGFDKPRTIISNGFAGELAVPLWARFMKVATAKHNPDTFKAPQGVMPVNVCRLSGQLPGEACDRVITEYFVRGAVPTQMCQEHYLYASSTQIAAVVPSNGGIVSIGPRIMVPVAAVAEAPPELVVASEKVEAAEQPKRKRGFWGRLFGRGKDDKADVESQSDATRRNR
jgi:penicillin-binding protein 1A